MTNTASKANLPRINALEKVIRETIEGVHRSIERNRELLHRVTFTYSTDVTEAARYVNNCADDYGRLNAYSTALLVIDNLCRDDGATDDTVIAGINAWLVRHLTDATDDTWSGRGNDAQRSRIDGERLACRNIADTIRYAK